MEEKFSLGLPSFCVSCFTRPSAGLYIYIYVSSLWRSVARFLLRLFTFTRPQNKVRSLPLIPPVTGSKKEEAAGPVHSIGWPIYPSGVSERLSI